MTGTHRSALRLLLLVAALVIGLMLSRHWPSERQVRVVLGDVAPRVVEVRLRYADAGQTDWQREVTFHYGLGQAPRVLSHAPTLASGDYDVEVEVEVVSQGARHTVTDRRRVQIDGGTAQIDVSARVRDSLDGAPP